MTRNLIAASALLLLSFGVVAVPVSADAAVETCQGKDATIVKKTGTVVGTAGDDVIIGGDHTVVQAGGGNDTVCVKGGDADGGGGVDSIEMVGGFVDDPGATVVDFEQLDVRTFYNLGNLDFEWTQVPSELSGAVNASYYPDARASKVLDNPTVNIQVPESSEFGLRVDRRSETVTIGEGLEFSLTGVDDIGMTAHKIRAFGDDARNFFFLTGCDVVARGGDGNDRLWMRGFKTIDKSCPGARLFGQRGPDKLEGTNRNDTLIGGADKDRAYGDKGKDRCVAEKQTACER
jgi:Ca2+-binding RTX toxin-like protein